MPEHRTPSRLTLRAFARSHDRAPSTVSGWKADGYLVLDGDLVDVAASDARLRDAGIGRFTPEPEPNGDPTLAEARRRKEIEIALKHRRTRGAAEAALVSRADVERDEADVWALVRSRVRAWPARVAPEMAEDLGVPVKALRAALESRAREFLARLEDVRGGADA